MDRTQLIEIIQEQYQELQSLSVGIERESLSQVVTALQLPHVVAITGMRRCGKSTLMLQALRQALSDQIYYLDFEDERLLEFTVDDFNLLYEVFVEIFGERHIFFFDEIQIVDHWEAYVRRMYKSGNKFVITGSSSELLSSELSTKLTGRHVAIELLPFSFHEYLVFSGNTVDLSKPILTKERALLKNEFNQFVMRGGLPEYLTYNNVAIIRSMYENILYKDVIVRYDIKAVKAIRELSLWLLSNAGSLISYSKLKNLLQLGSINTVKNYIHYLESAYLIFTLDRYAYSVGDQVLFQKKSYVIDTGLMHLMGFQFSKNRGKHLENIVYLELRRRYLSSSALYYYKTEKDYEVDFCVREGKNIILLIQVAENLDQMTTREREIRALDLAMEELNLKESYIITFDHVEEIKIQHKVIHCISVVSWLLKKD